jgi:hypothetical protein
MTVNDESFRMAHLVDYIERALPNIGFDEISKQMDCHSISAGFSPQRILEIFESILSQERETLIFKSNKSINSMRESRRSLRNAIRDFEMESEDALRPFYAKNLSLRRRLNQIASIQFDRMWMQKKSELRDSGSDFSQLLISQKSEAIVRLSKISKRLSELFESIREVVHKMKFVNRSNVTKLRQSVKVIAGHQLVNLNENPIIQDCQRELRIAQEITNSHREALNQLISHLNAGQKIPKIPIDISEVRPGMIVAALKSKIEQAKSAVSNSYEQTNRIADRIQSEIERRVNENENEYLTKLLKQKRTMRKLEQSLHTAETKLAGLLAFDAVVNPELLQLLEESRKTMEGSQERTDVLMRQLQESMNLSGILNES